MNQLDEILQEFISLFTLVTEPPEMTPGLAVGMLT